MTKIDKMMEYINRTKIKRADNYCMVYSEAVELVHMDDRFDALSLAFDYGKAKGYRAAQAERRAAV